MSDGPAPAFWQQRDPGDEDPEYAGAPEGGVPREANGHLLAEQLRRRSAETRQARGERSS